MRSTHGRARCTTLRDETSFMWTRHVRSSAKGQEPTTRCGSARAAKFLTCGNLVKLNVKVHAPSSGVQEVTCHCVQLTTFTYHSPFSGSKQRATRLQNSIFFHAWGRFVQRFQGLNGIMRLGIHFPVHFPVELTLQTVKSSCPQLSSFCQFLGLCNPLFIYLGSVYRYPNKLLSPTSEFKQAPCAA